MSNQLKIIVIILLFAFTAAAQTQIAVLNLLAKNVSEGDASALSDRLAIEMVRTGKYTVIERERLNEILDEQGFQMSGCTSDECIVQIGRLANVEMVVAGSVSRVGTVYSIAVRTVSVESGQILNIATYDYEGRIGELLKTGMRVVAEELSGLRAAPQLSYQQKAIQTQPQLQPPVTETKPTSASSKTTPSKPAESSYPRTEPTPVIEIPKMQIGVTGGLIAAGIIGEDVRDDATTRPMGLNGGLLAKYYVTNSMALRLEALYSQKGYAFPSPYDDNIEVRHLNDYVELPFLIQLEFNNQASSFGYVNFGATLGTATKYEYQIFDTDRNEEITRDELSGLNTTESVLTFGGGISLENSLFTEFRMDMGMTSIIDSGDPPDVRNFSLTIFFGYQFPLGI